MSAVPMPTPIENQKAEQLGQDQIMNTSSLVKKNTEKSLSARNNTYYDVLRDAGISMGDITLRNHTSTQD